MGYTVVDPEKTVRDMQQHIDALKAAIREKEAVLARRKAENERLRAALTEIGTDCRLYAEGCPEHGVPDRSYWCDCCIAREALEGGREEGR